MKSFGILALLIFTKVVTYAQLPVPIDSIYNTIKSASIHTKNADWSTIDIGFKQRLEVATNEFDSLNAFVYVFELLHDNHSGISYQGRYFSNFPEYDKAFLDYVSPLLDLSSKRLGVFSAELLEEKYLYLQIPGIQAMGDATSLYAQQLSDTLSKYTTKRTKGIILDLRLNGGGQLSSMVSGVAPLLGNTYVCGGINSDSIQTMEIKISNGNISLNNYQTTDIKHKTKLNLEKMPVVVLLGPATASSGSILAIAFKGRANTYMIGESTARGYTTSNDFFMFGNNLYLNLSTNHVTDRNNRVYYEVVEPDRVVRGTDNFQSIRDDEKVQIALDWLKKNGR